MTKVPSLDIIEDQVSLNVPLRLGKPNECLVFESQSLWTSVK